MRQRASLVGPMLLIAVGGLFLGHTIWPDFSVPDFIGRYWPVLLIIWGALQLIEVTARFVRNAPLPTNAIGGGSWFLICVICLFGLTFHEIRRPNTWWRRAGFEGGVEMFGDAHDYDLNALKQPASKTVKVVIDSFRGDARITGTDALEVTVAGHKTIRAFDEGEADRGNRSTPVEMVREGDTLVIRCNQNKASGHSQINTNLQITVPRGASIEANGRNGDFDVSDVAGNVDIVSENAGVRIQNVDGNVKVDTRRSDVIRCTGVKGSVELKGRGSDVELEKIAGQVSVLGDYSGNVVMRDLAKPLRLEGMQTTLIVPRLPGQVRYERGSLSVENAEGPVQVEARASDVEISGFTDSLQVSVDKGDIDLRPTRLPLAKMNVRTRSGNIDLAVPEAAKFALKASTEHGDVQNEFGEQLKQASYGSGGAILEGQVGGGPSLSLSTDRGTIIIRKASAADSPEKGKTADSLPTPPDAPKPPAKPPTPPPPVGKPVEL
jgi:DUF4097 and DUF4098 domain-containing protein YvlB